MRVLARALEDQGHTVRFETSARHLPVFTAERLWFNHGLRPDPEADLTVGFDMDGYRIAGSSPTHVAALKGVIADELRFESGLTRLTMGLQARCERLHVERAARVLVTSRYSAERAQEFYGLKTPPVVVPELIDLSGWPSPERVPDPVSDPLFNVLFVGRLYRRKRVNLLLEAAAALRHRIPNFQLRIIGNGPNAGDLRRQAEDLRLGDTVVWLGDVPRRALTSLYAVCDVFCLPSVQEGFGIVLLEAMASGKPIVAARAGAIPEVVPHATLVEPESAEALAAGIESLYRSPDLRLRQQRAGAERVRQYDAPRVARLFHEAAAGRVGSTATCNLNGS